MSSLKDKVIQAAARLWGKPESQIEFEWKPANYYVGVCTYLDEDDPDKGTLNWRVSVYPLPTEVPATDEAYQADLLHALLDVLEGALRRKEVRLSLSNLQVN
jgi:hypothetical protein